MPNLYAPMPCRPGFSTFSRVTIFDICSSMSLRRPLLQLSADGIMAPYFLRSLAPKRVRHENARSFFMALREVTPVQWALFASGWLAWTCDAIDFFSVSLSVTLLQDQFGKSTHEITTAITLTLLFRPVGALLFGLFGDRFGRKWPLIFNMMFVAVLELGAGFAQTFRQFLAIRCLFGIGMGAVWGLATSTGLENLPMEVRGLASGFIQQGYAVGYLIAAVINLFLVPEVSVGWRALFWTASGASLLAAIFRMVLPESELFLRANEAEAAKGTSSSKKTKVFIKETSVLLRKHWAFCVYGVLIMTGMSFLSHGSQDLYPTYMEVTKGMSSHDANVATIIGNCGAFTGGIFSGTISQYIGRRLTIVLLLIGIGVFIPLWIVPSTFGALAAGAFCIQFFVQGSLGVMPIQFSETSPPAVRATFPGVAYQIGAMIASASAQIEATAGDHLRTTIVKDGKVMDIPDYATVQGILIGVVALFTIIVALFGPENHGAHFEKNKTAFEEGAANEPIIIEDSIGDRGSEEKEVVIMTEKI